VFSLQALHIHEVQDPRRHRLYSSRTNVKRLHARMIRAAFARQQVSSSDINGEKEGYCPTYACMPPQIVRTCHVCQLGKVL